MNFSLGIDQMFRQRLPFMKLSRFRPCIDLHDGVVKQIVGGSLTDNGAGPKENFVSDRSPKSYAELFQTDGLTGGHVIKLGPGNEEAAREALAAWRGGLQIGGGMNRTNASEWLEAGASHVIVTSSVFDKDGRFLEDELAALSAEVGSDRVVLDLSCKRSGEGWTVAMNRWQTPTNLDVTPESLTYLSQYCDEFLIHAADVEGLCGGMDEELVTLLGCWSQSHVNTPVTYAGGIVSMQEVDKIQKLSAGTIHFTVGSALDLFGGSGLSYADLVGRHTV